MINDTSKHRVAK